MSNAVTIQLAVVGASNAVEQLSKVARSADSLQANVDKTRSQFIAAGTATAAFAGLALSSYESMERLRRVLSMTVGESKGTKLAAQIAAVAQEAKSGGAMLRQFAMNWVNMVDGGEKSVLRMMKALDKLGAGMTEDAKARASFQLAQIASLPTVQWEDVKELAQAGALPQGVAKSLGKSSPRDLSGMDSGRFLEAYMRYAEKAPDQKPLPTTAIMNALEKFVNALAPAGEKVAKALEPLIEKAEDFTDWFVKWDQDGTKSFKLIVAGLGVTTVAMARYMAAIVRATFALEGLARSAAIAATSGSAGSKAAAAAAPLGGGSKLVKAGLIGATAYEGWQAGTAIGDWADENIYQPFGFDNRGDAAYQAWEATKKGPAHLAAFYYKALRYRGKQPVSAADELLQTAKDAGYSDSDIAKLEGHIKRMNEAKALRDQSRLVGTANIEAKSVVVNGKLDNAAGKGKGTMGTAAEIAYSFFGVKPKSKAHKRSDLQNIAANVVSSAAGAF